MSERIQGFPPPMPTDHSAESRNFDRPPIPDPPPELTLGRGHRVAAGTPQSFDPTALGKMRARTQAPSGFPGPVHITDNRRPPAGPTAPTLRVPPDPHAHRDSGDPGDPGTPGDSSSAATASRPAPAQRPVSPPTAPTPPATRPSPPASQARQSGWAPAEPPPARSSRPRPAPPKDEQPRTRRSISLRHAPGEDAPDPFAGTAGRPGLDALLGATITEPERKLIPDGGWRRIAYDLTGGRWNPGLANAQAEREELIGVLRRPVAGQPKVIVVMSQKGEVGKTTTSVSLGTALAMYGPDSVLVIDVNPDAGSLGVKVQLTTKRTLVDLRDAMLSTARLTAAKFDEYVNRSEFGGLGAIVQQPGKKHLSTQSGGDQVQVSRFSGQELERLLGALRSDYPYKVVIIDCGTDVGGDVAAAAIKAADLLIWPTSPVIDSSVVNAGGLEVLEQIGGEAIVRNAITVFNHKANFRIGDVSPERAEEYRRNEKAFRSYYERVTARTIDVPYDPDLAVGGIYNPQNLKPATERAVLELAAAVKERLLAA